MGEFLNVTLMSGYRAAPSPLMGLVQKNMTVSGFSETFTCRRLIVSRHCWSRFSKVAKSLLVRWLNRRKPSKSRDGARALASVSFVSWCNDRLGATTDQIRAWGYSVAETEAKQIIAFLTQNAGARPDCWPMASQLFDRGGHPSRTYLFLLRRPKHPSMLPASPCGA